MRGGQYTVYISYSSNYQIKNELGNVSRILPTEGMELTVNITSEIKGLMSETMAVSHQGALDA